MKTRQIVMLILGTLNAGAVFALKEPPPFLGEAGLWCIGFAAVMIGFALASVNSTGPGNIWTANARAKLGKLPVPVLFFALSMVIAGCGAIRVACPKFELGSQFTLTCLIDLQEPIAKTKNGARSLASSVGLISSDD